jgi:hypothetical protein
MNLVIVIAGVVGLLIVGFALLDLAIDAGRHRRALDIVWAALVAVAVVWALLAYGDRLLQ